MYIGPISKQLNIIHITRLSIILTQNNAGTLYVYNVKHTYRSYDTWIHYPIVKIGSAYAEDAQLSDVTITICIKFD